MKTQYTPTIGNSPATAHSSPTQVQAGSVTNHPQPNVTPVIRHSVRPVHFIPHIILVAITLFATLYAIGHKMPAVMVLIVGVIVLLISLALSNRSSRQRNGRAAREKKSSITTKTRTTGGQRAPAGGLFGGPKPAPGSGGRAPGIPGAGSRPGSVPGGRGPGQPTRPGSVPGGRAPGSAGQAGRSPGSSAPNGRAPAGPGGNPNSRRGRPSWLPSWLGGPGPGGKNPAAPGGSGPAGGGRGGGSPGGDRTAAGGTPPGHRARRMLNLVWPGGKSQPGADGSSYTPPVPTDGSNIPGGGNPAVGTEQEEETMLGRKTAADPAAGTRVDHGPGTRRNYGGGGLGRRAADPSAASEVPAGGGVVGTGGGSSGPIAEAHAEIARVIKSNDHTTAKGREATLQHIADLYKENAALTGMLASSLGGEWADTHIEELLAGAARTDAAQAEAIAAGLAANRRANPEKYENIDNNRGGNNKYGWDVGRNQR